MDPENQGNTNPNINQSDGMESLQAVPEQSAEPMPEPTLAAQPESSVQPIPEQQPIVGPTPQPEQPAQQPEPVQMSEQPIQPKQPTQAPGPTPSMPQEQPIPQPMQPIQQNMPATESKPKTNFKLIGIIVAIILVVGIIAVVVVLLLNGTIGGGIIGNKLSVPSVEKIESVCEKYNGNFSDKSTNTVISDITVDVYSCPISSNENNYLAFSVMLANEDYLAIMDEVETQVPEDQKDQYQEYFGSVGGFVKFMYLPVTTSERSNTLTAIEDTKDYYKGKIVNSDYKQTMIMVAYKNIVVGVVTDNYEANTKTVENILTDLGLNK